MSIKSLVFKIRQLFRPSLESVDAGFTKTLTKLDKVLEDQKFIKEEAELAIQEHQKDIEVSTAKTKRAGIFKANLTSLMGMDSDNDGIPDVEQL